LRQPKKAGQGDLDVFVLDNKGTVIFTLPGGGIIRDSGAAIHFRLGDDDKTRAVAEKLARAKWGQVVSLNGNSWEATKDRPLDTGQQRPDILDRGI